MKLSIIKNIWPIIILAVVVLALVGINYEPSTFLTGGDNLHPEFNFPVNIERSLVAVWQEYQSLGLLGGMGHASDLLRQFFLWILSFVFPMESLRYLWTFLTLFLGAIGAYYLIHFILKQMRGVIEVEGFPTAWTERGEGTLAGGKLLAGSQAKIQTIALLGALFYLLNLATIQAYYTPFEVFSAHFAFLPWLLLATITYLKNTTRKNFILLGLTLLLSTPAAYVPTLFVVYLTASIILVLFVLPKASRSVLTAAKYYLVVFIINSFWLLPFAYFTITNSGVNLNAKINQMATDMITSRNKEFGSLPDVMLLKGFWFNNTEPNQSGNTEYMLEPWRLHLENVGILVIGYLLFAVVIFGVVSAFRSKNRILLGFSALFIITLSMLAIATPPFSWINEIIRSNFPFFNQIFRFPFTKFSILAALTYAVFFTYGIQIIWSAIEKRILNYESRIMAILKTAISYSLFLIPASLFILYSLPAFQGHLFYKKERAKIPQEYFEVFEFFKRQDQNTRIANFPQHSFWSWYFYNWGYSGSGFLWYGIEQPILDRAFDVWSRTSENYYYEISYALYSKNPTLFDSVLNKYHINWLVIDKNVINPSSQKALFYPELETLLESLPTIKKKKTFGNIDIYEVTLRENIKNFMYVTGRLPIVNTYAWGQDDLAYQTYGSYISAGSEGTFYPFRSLFTSKLEKEKSFSLHEEEEFISAVSRFTLDQKKAKLFIPAIVNKESIIPFKIRTQKEGNNQVIYVNLLSPQIYMNGKKLWGEGREYPLFVIENFETQNLKLNINGVTDFSIKNNSETVGITFLPINQDSTFTLTDTDSNASLTQTLSGHNLFSLPLFQEVTLDVEAPFGENTLEVKVPKINDSYLSLHITPHELQPVAKCDTFRDGTKNARISQGKQPALEITSHNASMCFAYYSSKLLHQGSYALFLNTKNISGRPLQFWLLNEDQKYSPLVLFLPKNESVSAFIIPPQEQSGKSYSFHFDNISIGNEVVKNSFVQGSLYPFSYSFISSLAFENKEVFETSNNTIKTSLQSTHPNDSLYLITHIKNIPDTAFSTLVLSQSFNPGWKAYEVRSKKSEVRSFLDLAFPFIFGKEIKDHVLVNNWSNGWIVDSAQLADSKVVIIYFPQYYQYVGFLFLFLFFLAPIYILSNKLSGIGVNTIQKKLVLRKVKVIKMG